MENKIVYADYKEARRAYHKKWRDRNKDKIREYNRRFWVKQAAKLAAEAANAENNTGGGNDDGQA